MKAPTPAVTILVCALLALFVSLAWNVHQAREKVEAVELAYLRGYRGGLEWAYHKLHAAILEQQREEQEAEADAHIAEEKL